MRSLIFNAINDHWWVPYFSANFTNTSSSYLYQINIIITTFFFAITYLLCPRTFYKFWIQYFLPTVQTLNICSTFNLLCNLLPIFALMALYCLYQYFILYNIIFQYSLQNNNGILVQSICRLFKVIEKSIPLLRSIFP